MKYFCFVMLLEKVDFFVFEAIEECKKSLLAGNRLQVIENGFKSMEDLHIGIGRDFVCFLDLIHFIQLLRYNFVRPSTRIQYLFTSSDDFGT